MAKEPRWEPVELSTDVYGQTFTFDLCHRGVDLGPNLTVQYYWMNSALVRKGTKSTDLGLRNVSNCIELWWRIVRHTGVAGDLGVLQQFLLANLYPLFARSKGQQRVFLDAIPGGRGRFPKDRTFDPTSATIDAASSAKNLHELLRGKLFPQGAEEFAESMIGRALSWGIGNVLEHEAAGLVEFKNGIKKWAETKRRKGYCDWTAWTLDLLAYHSKLAFYECYNNAWIALTQQLEQQLEPELDPASLAFHDVWHFQDFNASPNQGAPGPLGGIPLAMHPISGYLMRIPELAEACGNFIIEKAQHRFDPVSMSKQESYRIFCQAIEFAARQYEAKHSGRELRRGGTEISADGSVSLGDLSFIELTDFLCHQREKCVACGGDVEIKDFTPIRQTKHMATFEGHCRRCHQSNTFEINFGELRRFLFDPDY